MKLRFTLFALLACCCKSVAQDWNALAKADLKPLYETFVSKNDSLQKEKGKLTALTEQLNPDQAAQFEKTRNLKLAIDSLYKKRTTLATFYAEKKVETDSLSVFFPEQSDFVLQENALQKPKALEEKTTYFLFGDNELIKEEELIKNTEVNKIFSKVLSEDSQSNLGKFEIPALGQPIPVYIKCEEKSDCEARFKIKEKELNDIKLRAAAYDQLKATLNQLEAAIKNEKDPKTLKQLQQDVKDKQSEILHKSIANAADSEKVKKNEEDIKKCIESCDDCHKNTGINKDRSKQWYKDLRFEEVNITIKEGAFEDIRVVLIDKITNEKYYFENKLSSSMLRYTRNAKDFYLHCSFVTSIDNNKAYNHNKYNESCYISLKDVLQYYPNSGNNYVPDDQNLVFPIANNKNQETNSRSIYQLVQNTSLQNTVELRTYTDFLGLFNESPNGVVQIEGRAEFFANPFRLAKQGFFQTFYVGKKISPYVNFSKIDNENRGIDLQQTITGEDTISSVKHPLQIVEKAFLELGININVLSFKIVKEMPFKVNFYVPARYYTSALYNDKEKNINMKMVSFGGGLNFEFKKFSNFGLNFSVELSNYNPINRSDEVTNPKKFWVSRNEAEIFYFPGVSKNQSIFARFRTYYNANDDEDSFFQFQFGYRFSIGTGRVKSSY